MAQPSSSSKRPQTTAKAGVPKAVDSLVFKDDGGLILDVLITSKAQRRPAWLTSTTGSKTSLYAVSTVGRLEQMAAIHWAGVDESSKPNKGQVVMVEMGGKLSRAEDFCVKASGSFGRSSTYSFHSGNLRCRWVCKDFGDDPDEYGYISDNLAWQCIAENTNYKEDETYTPTTPARKRWSFFGPSSASSSSTNRQKLLLATWQPPITAGEEHLKIYLDGLPHVFHLLLSFILFNTKRDAWKKVQSKMTPEEVEAALLQDLAGGLPTYTPVRDGTSTAAGIHPTLPATSPWRWTPKGQAERRSESDL
ncbi:hypothetical protein FRC17_007677 [Serendipita sp. 399]|nr:hypothetical protein FRC17_007677 [Serendipita sp. 399]